MIIFVDNDMEYESSTVCMTMRKNISKWCLAMTLMVLPLISYAQWFGSMTDRINTLRMIVDGDWERPAIVDMESNEKIEFSFDDMSHEYHRFTYHIQHCDAQWQPSDILESDYLDGFNDETIDDWENSLNTTFDYTHYRLTLPNSQIRLKISGNYRLSIREDGQEVAYFRFCLSEGRSLISAKVNGNTDIDSYDSHQQLDLAINYGSLTVRDPSKELYTVIMQNLRTDNMVTNPTPTYDAGNRLTYEHSSQLIFQAGNEFRRFEAVNMYDFNLNVDRISFHDPFYHATLMQDTRRHAYKFDYDHNGRYLIRYNQASDSDTEADYLFVHFNLASDRLTGGKLYIYGHFTGGNLTSRYQMEYNDIENCYQASILLKQGAYDYQYLWVPDGASAAQTKPAEGDWYESKNDYLILLYYRQRGSRYDRLISAFPIASPYAP
ncbi:MAG: DUF5103 domain-containing protein [Bacteroidaceae bacterium]|nr:DUF5103 domain-containing protein [Bacteroidaceae bacterium]